MTDAQLSPHRLALDGGGAPGFVESRAQDHQTFRDRNTVRRVDARRGRATDLARVPVRRRACAGAPASRPPLARPSRIRNRRRGNSRPRQSATSLRLRSRLHPRACALLFRDRDLNRAQRAIAGRRPRPFAVRAQCRRSLRSAVEPSPPPPASLWLDREARRSKRRAPQRSARVTPRTTCLVRAAEAKRAA